MRSPRSVERRVVGLVGEARLAIPDYGERPLGEVEVDRLTGVFNLSTHVVESEIPAILFPPIDGMYRLAVDRGLPRSVRTYVKLHELGHVLLGEAEEPMQLIFFGALPESEDVVDLFALLGVMDPVHESEGADWLELQIRALVPLDDKGWQVHRIPRLARKLPRVREMVRERLPT